MILYAAYGSNLNKAHMRRRCFNARPLGKFYLTDARLVFRGVADVEYSPGDRVPCGLWSISPDDEAKLDRYEGVSSGYYFKDRSIKLRYRGEEHRPLIYLMTSTGVYPPSAAYIEAIRDGYRDFALDQSYLDRAIVDSFNNKKPDSQTKERRLRQLNNPRTRRLVPMPESVALRRLQLLRDDKDWGEAS